MAVWIKALDWRPSAPRVRISLGQLRIGTLAIPSIPLCQCLSEETLKAVGPFYLVSLLGEVKYSAYSASASAVYCIHSWLSLTVCIVNV